MWVTEDYVTLLIPRDEDCIQVAVHLKLLDQAPWLPRAIEAMVAASGQYWPEEARLMDELEWICSTRARNSFVVPDWVFEPVVEPQKQRAWGRLLQQVGTSSARVFEHLFKRWLGMKEWYVATAIYPQLVRCSPGFAGSISEYDFAKAVENQCRRAPRWKALARTVLPIAWMLLIILPLFVATWLYWGCSLILLSAAVKIFPGHRPSRYRRLILIRDLRKFKRGVTASRRQVEAKISSRAA